MKLTTKATVTGIKRSKGTLESGQSYDSTKVYVMTDLDDRKGNGLGSATVEYSFGTSEEFAKFEHLGASFPIECEAEIEIITTGREQRTILTGLRPIARSTPAKA